MGAKRYKVTLRDHIPATPSSILAKGLSKPKEERVNQRGEPPGTGVRAILRYLPSCTVAGVECSLPFLKSKVVISMSNSHQQWMRVAFVPHLCQQLIFSHVFRFSHLARRGV